MNPKPKPKRPETGIEPTRRVVIDLPESLHAAITALAKRNDRSLAGQVRWILKEAVEK